MFRDTIELLTSKNDQPEFALARSRELVCPLATKSMAGPRLHARTWIPDRCPWPLKLVFDSIRKPLPIPFFLVLLFWLKENQPLSFWGYFG